MCYFYKVGSFELEGRKDRVWGRRFFYVIVEVCIEVFFGIE